MEAYSGAQYLFDLYVIRIQLINFSNIFKYSIVFEQLSDLALYLCIFGCVVSWDCPARYVPVRYGNRVSYVQ